MHQLSPQDAQFLYAETEHNLTHVTSVAIYDPSTVPGGATVRYRDIIAHVEDRLQYNPLLLRRLLRLPLEIDYPYWVEDEFFDLEYHMQHGRLPEPGDWRQFCIHMARYHSRPLDMNRPPWEIFVVEGLDHVDGLPAGCYAIATKIHHAAVDGASLMKFFASMADSDPYGTPMIPLEAPNIESAEVPELSAIMSRAVRNNLRSPLNIARTVMRAAPGLVQAAQESVARRGGEDEKKSVPPTRFNVDLSPHKMFDARDVPLDDLKRLRALQPGATINDVVLAICSGALRRYLQHHDELPEESLVAWVPINARPSGSDGGDMPGNNISAMTTAIFTDEPDPQKRLQRIQQSTRASKEARSGVSARLMTDITKHVPAATQVLASRLLVSSGTAARMCNLFISNVPGPQIPMYMNGARMVRSVGLAPLADGMGLFIGTPSYDGKMSFNVISTREVLPDIEFFMQCIDASLQELLALLPAAGAPRVKRAPRGKAPEAKQKRQSAVKATGTSRATTKTKAKTKTKAATKAKTRATAKSKAATKTKPATKPKASTKAKARPKAKAKVKAKARPKAKAAG